MEIHTLNGLHNLEALKDTLAKVAFTHAESTLSEDERNHLYVLWLFLEDIKNEPNQTQSWANYSLSQKIKSKSHPDMWPWF